LKTIYLRSLTGALLLAAIIGSIVLGMYSYALCIVALIVFSMIEFYAIMKKMGYTPQVVPGIIAGVALFGISFLISQHRVDLRYLLLLVPLVASFFIVELYKKHSLPLQNVAVTLVGLVYVAVPFSMCNFLVFNQFNHYQYAFGLILALFGFNWTNDTGAYLFGITLGRHRLFERISPKKSWEGACGGVACVVAISFLFAYLMPYISLLNWIVLGLLVCVFGIYGDLIESLLKRSAGVKDSGTLLPGHGGFLDRFDAVIFSIPPFFAYLVLIQ
jgi:phosphatidate cytidylyltransferase